MALFQPSKLAFITGLKAFFVRSEANIMFHGVGRQIPAVAFLILILGCSNGNDVNENRREIEAILSQSGIVFPESTTVLSCDFNLEDACRVIVFSKEDIPVPVSPGQVLIEPGKMDSASDGATTKALLQSYLRHHKIGDPKPRATFSRRWQAGGKNWRELRTETIDGYYVMLERMEK